MQWMRQGNNISIKLPHVEPPILRESCYSSKQEQLSRLTNVGFKVFVLLPSRIIFVKSQE
jgi:hypothetical protein